MGKYLELRKLLKTYFFLTILINVAQAYSSGNGTYRTNFCLCQMDVYLLKVRQMLSIGQVPPATPPTTTPGPTTTNTAPTSTSTPKTTTNTGTTTINTASTTTNTGSTTTAGSTTTNTATFTTNTGSTTAANPAGTTTNTGPTTTADTTNTHSTAGSTSTTSVAMGKRRKRQAAATSTTVGSAVTGTGSTTTVSSAAAGTGSTSTKASTTKASTTKASATTAASQKITLGSSRDYIAGIATPTFGVVFDGSVKLVDDYGVFFDSNYNPSLCPCASNQTVEVGMCLLNVPYNASYANINSTQSHAIVGKLLPWLDNTLINAFNSNPIYIRVLPRRIQSFNNKSAQLFVEVNLRNATFKPDFYVNNAINPSLTVVIPPAVVMGYQVDIAQTGCYSVADVTPVAPVVLSAMYYLRFVAIPIALAVLAFIIFCTCCGSRDKFYVRFW